MDEIIVIKCTRQNETIIMLSRFSSASILLGILYILLAGLIAKSF